MSPFFENKYYVVDHLWNSSSLYLLGHYLAIPPVTELSGYHWSDTDELIGSYLL